MKNTTLLLLVFMSLGVLSACSQSFEQPQPENMQVLGETSDTAEPALMEGTISNGYTLDDVAKHSTKDNCWVTIDSKVYNISAFIALGVHKPIIEEACGTDASEKFTEHSPEAKEKLPDFYIGELI